MQKMEVPMIKSMENLSKRCCPKCGGTSGLESSFQGVQYYTWDGEVDGYSLSGSQIYTGK